MKTFFTIIPLQGSKDLKACIYQAVDNGDLQMDTPTHFPIMTAMHAYVKPGDEIRVVAILSAVQNCETNLEKFREEVENMSQEIGFTYPRGIEIVNAPADAGVRSHIETFQRLIEKVEDNDKLYACMTYGMKPLSQLLIMAIQYAYRLLDNASICCLVYGQPGWGGAAPSVNDMTALIQMDEITRLLAEHKVKNPRTVIEKIISQD
ncbi:TM1812 family CRISPR-associated protein [Butyricicoccus sp. OF10-2]|jgi:hypothetical protein|uniref:TM1812 family CRISPR-associated protein n=1 Tax=Butyricicoccus sp. OF10-2 TaxID=2292298 RepID=UPI000E5D32E5|nr:TM1812 family CRISPR-associated protein [Butyricicoccus sp. OF10-2]RHV78520.1 hypothetical protein DXB00_15460 [Butyricicoccus sp. OF10-2]